MYPWLNSNFNFPLSGSVNQDISPEFFFNSIKRGNGDIEKAIFTSGASYGRQLGMISGILLEVIEALNLSDDVAEVKKFKELQKTIDQIKELEHHSLETHAVETLTNLQSQDKRSFERVMRQFSTEK